MKLLASLLLFLSIVPHDAYSQSNPRQITARVVDSETKKPIGGVRVTVKGTLIEAETNVTGFFQIPIDNIKVLVLVYPDYEDILVNVPEVDKFQIQMTKKSAPRESAKIYLDEYGFQTDSAAARYYWIISENPNDTNRSFIHEFRIDKTPRQTWSFVHGDIITKDGNFVSYFSNGKKQAEGVYRNNSKIGKWTEWYEDGKIKEESAIRNERRRFELLNYWDSVGTQLISNGNGELIIRSNGEVKYTKGLIKDGVKSGVWTGFFKNESKAFEETYDNGRLVKGRSYDSQGKEYKYDELASSSISKLLSQLRYPADARRKHIEGKVIVHFLVDPDGNILKSEVVRGIGSGCDEEALRIIKANGKWDWGKRRGQEYKSAKPQALTLPIVFKLG